MIKPITDEQLAQLDEWYKGYPSGDTAEPKQDFDSEVGMLYGAIRERLRLAEAVVKATDRLSDNIAEFDTITDNCFLEHIDEVLAAYRAATEVKT